MVSIAGVLELSLNVENRPLRSALAVIDPLAWEPAAEDDASSLWQDFHMLAERPPDQLEDRRLARARAAGQHDAPAVVGVCAFALHCSSVE
jgi:hypothetical protein